MATVRVAAEHHYNSADDLATHLAEAMILLEKEPLSELERAHLLPKLLELLAAKHVQLEQVALFTPPPPENRAQRRAHGS